MVNGAQGQLKKTDGSGSEQPWSVRMASTVMERYPELTDMDRLFHKRKNPKWQYDIAMLAQAIDKLGSVDEKYSRYMKRYIDFFIGDDGSIYNYNLCDYNMDKINPGNNLILLYQRTGEEKYKKAIDQLVDQLEGQPHNPDGGFWHKSIYPHQMWLDGIYMSSPFMARYAQAFNEPEWYDEVVRQITVIEKHTRDIHTGLLYHGYDASRGMKWSNDSTGCSPHFWGRAMGWYLMAIVDALDFFPESHPGRNDLIAVLNRTSEALLKVRDKETGLWYQVLDRPDEEGNYLESTGTCMFAYAFAKGANRGYLDQSYLDVAEEAFESILKEFIRVDADGRVNITNACYGAGLGGLHYRSGSYEYYISERSGMNDSKAVAPFIMLSIELNR
ncbi:MAG: glycoside hydrolase family 88 protein [Bacteroidales bacterium]|nr:glycoside hydrolase family 88 protein [Bacteroidales bacterium]